MYAETQRERVEMLEALRRSEWNAEMDPVVVTSTGGQIVQHDFSQGYVRRLIGFEFLTEAIS